MYVQAVKLQVMLTTGAGFSQLRHLYDMVKISATSQKQALRNSASSTETIQYPKFLAAGRSFKIRFHQRMNDEIRQMLPNSPSSLHLNLNFTEYSINFLVHSSK